MSDWTRVSRRTGSGSVVDVADASTDGGGDGARDAAHGGSQGSHTSRGGGGGVTRDSAFVVPSSSPSSPQRHPLPLPGPSPPVSSSSIPGIPITIPATVTSTPLNVAARGDLEMDKIFEDFRKSIAALRDDEHKTRQTLEVMQSKENLFDEEDIRVVAAVLNNQQTELSIQESEFRNLQEMYQREVVELENILYEKEQVLRDLDKSLGAISSQAPLRQHFGRKQASLHRTLQELKLSLCVRTQRSKEASAAARDSIGGPEGAFGDDLQDYGTDDAESVDTSRTHSRRKHRRGHGGSYGSHASHGHHKSSR